MMSAAGKTDHMDHSHYQKGLSTSKPKPHAAVIIPHLDDVSRLERCLFALTPQVSDAIEIIVVDNGSNADFNSVQKRFPTVRFIEEHQPGAAAARNRGVAESSAELLFFLDCDVVPASNWVSTALAHSLGGDVIGGHISVFDESAPPRTGAQAFEAIFAFDNQGYIEKKGFSVTANLLTRRDVFMAVGTFRPGLSEDLDWCRRATDAGFRLVFAADLKVAHPSRSDSAALFRKWRRLTHEGYAVNGNSVTDRLRWAAKAMAMPISILIHTPRVLTNPAFRDGLERRNAWKMLVALRLRRMLWMLFQVLGGKLVN